MNNIWFTSDTHYGHKNIVRGTTEWGQFEPGSSHQGVRDFDTLEEHNEALVKSLNGLVKENDTLYHLGDWSFGGHKNIEIFRNRLNCKNIHLIFGNHDQHVEPIDSPYRKLFSSVGHYKEINLKIPSRNAGKYGKTHIIMSHFAMRVWNKSHHGSIMLYGHSHGTLPDSGFRSMDVGVDTHDLYPYHLDEIMEIMCKRDWRMEVDHHNSSTN
jgi:calcineurin-like phosphoesterase family protein